MFLVVKLEFRNTMCSLNLENPKRAVIHQIESKTQNQNISVVLVWSPFQLFWAYGLKFSTKKLVEYFKRQLAIRNAQENFSHLLRILRYSLVVLDIGTFGFASLTLYNMSLDCIDQSQGWLHVSCSKNRCWTSISSTEARQDNWSKFGGSTETVCAVRLLKG